jgi:hypothetical protein
MSFHKISKLEAARRQLETAIKLFFNDSDSISIHTLAAASHNVLKDLDDEDKKVITNDKILEFVKEDMKKEFFRIMRKPQNFFKHANQDPESELRFNPEVNEIDLFFAVWQYYQFSDDPPFWIRSYKVWFMIKKPDVFVGLGEPYITKQKEISQEDFLKNKAEFIKMMKKVEHRYIT